MANYTTNYKLKKPLDNEYFDLNDFNDNADLIDIALKTNADSFTSHEAELMAQRQHTVIKCNKDISGIYTTVTLKRQDDTVYMTSILSGGTSPKYTTRTETYYKTDGVTVDVIGTYTRSYDSDDELLSEVIA